MESQENSTKEQLIEQYFEQKSKTTPPSEKSKQKTVRTANTVLTYVINAIFLSTYVIIALIGGTVISGIVNAKEMLSILGYNFDSPEENSGILEALKNSGDTVFSVDLPTLYENRYEIMLLYILVPFLILVVVHVLILVVKRYIFSELLPPIEVVAS